MAFCGSVDHPGSPLYWLIFVPSFSWPPATSTPLPCVWVHMHTHVQAEGALGHYWVHTIHLAFWDTVPYLPVRLGWLADPPHWSACLNLLGARITGTCHHTCFSGQNKTKHELDAGAQTHVLVFTLPLNLLTHMSPAALTAILMPLGLHGKAFPCNTWPFQGSSCWDKYLLYTLVVIVNIENNLRASISGFESSQFPSVYLRLSILKM